MTKDMPTMAPRNGPEIDLDAPFEEDVILEVRSSKMKTMPGLTIQSGIDKTIRDGQVPVGTMGLDGDEHDPTFHGGVDKAVHGCENCESLSLAAPPPFPLT
jgi:hypothetical protein